MRSEVPRPRGVVERIEARRLMSDRLSRISPSRAAAEDDARRATAELFARVAAARRRRILLARLRPRPFLIDLVVVMATYAGITIAVAAGAVYGLRAAFDLLSG